MAKRILDMADLWDLVVGASALATGGGGVGPTRAQFEAVTEPALCRGLQPTIVDLADVPDDALIYVRAGAGGGVRREEKERWLANPGWGARRQPGFDATQWIASQLDALEYLYPDCDWSERPSPGWQPASAAEERLQELVGQPSYAYMPFEIGPTSVYTSLLTAAEKGRALVDASAAGWRAVPEISLSSLNVFQVPVRPVVFTTAWGDQLILEQVLNWQRLEDIGRHLAVASGGSVASMSAFPGSIIKGSAIAGTISLAMRVGRAIQDAVSAGSDPAAAAANAADGYVLFRGRILARLNEDKGAFIWGDERLDGTNEFAGHTFRIWYKNENHMSWLDGHPYVMSPDLVTVLDAQTGYGLSNFADQDWAWGREVVVLGVPCPPVWRTERGLRIFHPQRWGFACDYRPIEEVVA